VTKVIQPFDRAVLLGKENSHVNQNNRITALIIAQQSHLGHISIWVTHHRFICWRQTIEE